MEEKENKKGKTFYERWWFWVIIVIIITIIIGSSQIEETSTNTQNVISNKNISETIVEKVKVTVIDFSQMSKEEIQNWCTTNNVVCNITEEYSDTVEKGTFIRQSPQGNETAYEGDKISIVYSLGKEPTIGEKNALSSAKSYLRTMPFSYSRLIKQLEYEGYTTTEATYGADNCSADWNEQAAKSAQSYINIMSFSRSELIKQLKYEGFTNEQAEYGATAVGY